MTLIFKLAMQTKFSK